MHHVLGYGYNLLNSLENVMALGFTVVIVKIKHDAVELESMTIAILT